MSMDKDEEDEDEEERERHIGGRREKKLEVYDVINGGWWEEK